MRKFILGVGAQKSGTSWVYSQLLKYENFKRPCIKEMHIFDSIYIGECAGIRESIETKFSKALLKGKDHYEQLPITKRMQMILDQDQYFKYYDGIMNEENCLSADITPSYSGLPVDVLKTIRSEFEKISVEVRVVFLMREPVARLESAIRMYLRTDKKLEKTSVETMMRRMKRISKSEHDNVRSSYRDTVSRIRSCFSEDEIYLGFYETMFEEEELARFGKFLDIDHKMFDVGEKVNSTRRSFKYPKEFLLRMQENYSDNYAFVTEELNFNRDKWDSVLDNMTGPNVLTKTGAVHALHRKIKAFGTNVR